MYMGTVYESILSRIIEVEIGRRTDRVDALNGGWFRLRRLEIDLVWTFFGGRF